MIINLLSIKLAVLSVEMAVIVFCHLHSTVSSGYCLAVPNYTTLFSVISVQGRFIALSVNEEALIQSDTLSDNLMLKVFDCCRNIILPNVGP